jgi:hypothetical protein
VTLCWKFSTEAQRTRSFTEVFHKSVKNKTNNPSIYFNV